MNFKALTLALGANLGDRSAALARARTQVQSRIGPLLAASAIHETPAWGHTDQPDFLNQVIVVDLSGFAPPAPPPSPDPLAPLRAYLHGLLAEVQAIEAELGRQRDLHWGPRTCDLDLIFLDDLRYEDDRLSLPHPWWRQRDFVGGIIHRELREHLPFFGEG